MDLGDGMRRRFRCIKIDVCASAKSLMLSGWARLVWGVCRPEIWLERILGEESLV